jgi:hypothetical protein
MNTLIKLSKIATIRTRLSTPLWAKIISGLFLGIGGASGILLLIPEALPITIKSLVHNPEIPDFLTVKHLGLIVGYLGDKTSKLAVDPSDKAELEKQLADLEK